MRDALADLVLGSACVGCRHPGRVLCRDCWGSLPAHARRCPPTPSPAGLADPWCAAEYAGVVRAMVLAHKERACHGLARPLGELLATAVVSALGEPGEPGESGGLLLVPVPSHPVVVRTRGHDPLLRLTRAAVRRLRSAGVQTGVGPLLVTRSRPRDQAGLDAQARAANLREAFAARPAALRLGDRLGGPGRDHDPAHDRVRVRARVVVVDDVLTTGATAREAQRVLEAVGLPVHAVAVVAATTRRRPPGGVSPQPRPTDPAPENPP